MPANTPKRVYPYPVDADTVNIPRDMQALAVAVDTDVWNRGHGLVAISSDILSAVTIPDANPINFGTINIPSPGGRLISVEYTCRAIISNTAAATHIHFSYVENTILDGWAYGWPVTATYAYNCCFMPAQFVPPAGTTRLTLRVDGAPTSSSFYPAMLAAYDIGPG